MDYFYFKSIEDRGVRSGVTQCFLLLKMQETQRLMVEPVPGIKAIPHEENARYFDVVVDGPKEVCLVCSCLCYDVQNLHQICDRVKKAK